MTWAINSISQYTQDLDDEPTSEFFLLIQKQNHYQISPLNVIQRVYMEIVKFLAIAQYLLM